MTGTQTRHGVKTSSNSLAFPCRAIHLLAFPAIVDLASHITRASLEPRSILVTTGLDHPHPMIALRLGDANHLIRYTTTFTVDFL